MKKLLSIVFLLIASFLFLAKDVSAQGWLSPVNISNNSIPNTGIPIASISRVKIDNAGTIHAVYCDYTYGEMFYVNKLTGGSWSSPVNLSQNSGDCSNSVLAVSPDGSLHVAWEDSTGGVFNIFYASKPAGGAWSTPISISNCGFSCATYDPSLAITSDGTLHLIWWDAAYDPAYPNLLYSAKSPGGSWSIPVQIASGHGGSYTSLAVDSNDTLHVVWSYADHLATVPNIYYLTKPSGGSWSSQALVSDCFNADACSFPVIAAKGTTLYLVWHRTSNWPNYWDVYYSTKVGSGSWSTPVNLSNNAGTSRVWGGGLGVDALGNVHVVWEDNTTGNYEVMYSELVNGSWSSPLNLSNSAGDSRHPAIAIDANGYSHVLWGEVLASGHYEVYYTTNLPPNTPPTANAGGPYMVAEGSSVILMGSGSDPDSDPLTYAWDLDNNGTFETPGQNVGFSGVDGPSSQTVILRVCDNKGACTTASTTVNITNVQPTVGVITAPTDPLAVNSTVNTSAAFTDPGVLDTHTAVWNWGDTTNSVGTVTETNGSGSVTGSHIYTSAGVYTVSLTVTDKDGGSGQSIFQYIVIFDSTAGFVTGAGAINSPFGAYPQDVSLAGRANFGFSVKYLPGDTAAPNGGSQFKFRLANINFSSTFYQWLVISGSRATFKGIGTNNGTGSYTFLVSTIDGSPDKYRIKITDNTTSTVFYDNEMGYSETADPTTPLLNGNIVIH